MSDVAIRRQEVALLRLQTDHLLKAMIEKEPALLMIMQEAATQTDVDERWFAYEELKALSSLLVGHTARNPELSTSQHYEQMIKAIDELLPDICDEEKIA